MSTTNFEFTVSEEVDPEHIATKMLSEAYDKNVSDIHIEYLQKNCQIRERIDGILYFKNMLEKSFASRLINHFKILGSMNIAEKRLPQDGQFKINQQGKVLNIRVSTCPTLFGEKIVLRLIHQTQFDRDINELQFSENQKTIFLSAINKPQGLILVTGPTGSGKTVTLYSALKHLNNPKKNILTVEDPVEIHLDGINQVNVNNKVGLTFSNTLRSFLRQDPDIIMVGEIRDFETAEIAVKSAQTGHLVLSTLHTNSAEETIVRLNQMGIASYHLINALTLITGQRLLRRLCPHCKKMSNDIPPIFREKIKSCFKAVGCLCCQNGYKGRIAVHELIFLDEKTKAILNERCSQKNVEKISLENTLLESALNKIKEGETTFDELYRVIDLNL